MTTPGERIENAEKSAATSALLRFVTAYLMFGYFDVVGLFIKNATVSLVPVEGSSRGLPAGVRNLFAGEPIGDSWIAVFLVVALAVLAAKAAVVIFAVKWRAEPIERPWLALVAALGGLIATASAFIGNLLLTVNAHEEAGVEALAAIGMAQSIAAMVIAPLNLILFGILAIYLFIGVLQRPAGEPIDGPYRDP